ncbi:carbon-nitrogen hydrolase [Plectosphaerella plurivora]|uniref:Carbon-nitrogen hydrolase n=1 Tax=Plectosphaerella plurivora TaxID=936078 RepID=A0A9P8VP38_9PEZI|nr:carbon-nitrogen hydrolase [Plectosphaerella plurivora]
MRTPFRALSLLSSSIRTPTIRPLTTFYRPTPLRSSPRPPIRTMASTSSPLKQPVKLACVQLSSGADKDANLSRARSKVLEAAKLGARIVVLPEIFNSPYGTDFFPRYAEQLLPSPPSRDAAPSFHALASMASDAGVYLVGGSIPELEVDEATGKKSYYNTSLTFSPAGELLATHRKIHLFDIDIPGKITFRESDVLSPGNKVTIVDLPEYGRISVGICYDVRFPEPATIAAREGCFALIYPGAFNLTTGPLHWKLLAQGRAMDNQMYVAMCSPARDMDGPYHAYGHSMIIDPLAQVVAETEEKEDIVVYELDGERIAEVRRNIPLTTQRRFDVYPDVSKGDVRYDEPGAPGKK